MERGGSSNIPHKYSTRAPKSGLRGIVIREGAAANPSIPATDAPTPPPTVPESFKRDTDQYMPIANVTRIMRRILPPHAKIADDAKEIVQECVSEFIGLITAEANQRCHNEYRKTISPEDLLSAMAALGFNKYAETLTVFLNRYRAQDPERSSSSQLRFPVVRRCMSFAGQPPAAQVPRPSIPVVTPPPVNMGHYVPAAPEMMMPPPNNAADGGDEYVDLPQLMREYLMGNPGGNSGEGSSRGTSNSRRF